MSLFPKDKISKFPWGILFGVSLMLFSYLVVGYVGVKIVSYEMIANSGGDDGLGQSWWLTPMLIAAIVLLVASITFLVFYILRNKHNSKIINKKED